MEGVQQVRGGGDGLTIDDDWSEPAPGNQGFLLDLPDVVTTTLSECIATLRDYSRQLTQDAPGLVVEALARHRAGR